MLPQEAKDNGHRHHPQVMARKFFVPRRDAAEPLQAVDAPLDDVPPSVGLLVELPPAALLVLLVGDDRLDAPLPQPLAEPARRVPLVPGDLRRLSRPVSAFLRQGEGLLRLVLLAGADGHRQRRPLPVADQVQFGAEAALAAAQGMVLRFTGGRFFFPPPRPPTGAPG